MQGVLELDCTVPAGIMRLATLNAAFLLVLGLAFLVTGVASLGSNLLSGILASTGGCLFLAAGVTLLVRRRRSKDHAPHP
jgi:preprotein translocase subunit SecF